MKARRKAVLLLALTMLLLSGCWDRAEVEDQAYVVLMGLDRDPDGAYTITAQTAIVEMLSAGSLKSLIVPTTPVLAAETLTARGKTITQAVFILNGGMTRRLDIRHLRAVLIGEGLARAGLQPVAAELLRSPLSRGASILIQARGNAADVIAALKPVGEINPARMVEGMVLQAKQIHLSPPTLFHHFINRVAAVGTDPYLPVAAVNPHVLEGQAHGDPGKSAMSGDLARAGGNPVEIIGTAVYRHDRLAGFLNVDDTQMLLGLQGKMGKAPITMPDPDNPQMPLTVRLHQENRPLYRTWLEGGRPHASVAMAFEAELLAAPGGTDYTQPDARRRLEVAVKGVLEKSCRKVVASAHEWSADPVGFGQRFRSYFATWDDWNRYDWSRHVDDLEVTCSARVRVRRYGLRLGGAGLGTGK